MDEKGPVILKFPAKDATAEAAMRARNVVAVWVMRGGAWVRLAVPRGTPPAETPKRA